MSAGSNELVYIGLGANLDQPQQQIEEALRRIALVPGASLRAASAMYRSGPWGRQDQPDFINAIAAVDTMLSPFSLIEQLLKIERDMGRVRDDARWGPRRIDLDVILIGQRTLSTTAITLPHPHYRERAFVLLPLLELGSRLSDDRSEEWRLALSKLTHDDVVRLPPESEAHFSV